ncbi:IS256 family transposase [Streptomyces marianii]|uniref:Mutator family transposase n=1 Tax=Streptomyces marianii TaxID=1817406 RepID=A0A5R9DTH6_9ACTN|nr:IS256 family transposase [Streptomyces marianii]TLQ38983.1 IS256 family transposase [Streptomyces marianii]TLQ41970.1 IS256 family transposase [Streptomyces marianii]TLQ43100.1 IS256 family transposase [Streptomyces marianii]
MLSVVNEDGTTQSGSLMDDIVREGARRMLAAALEAEVNQYIAELAGERDEAGRRLVVRNGHHRERTVATAAGPIVVKAPRVNDKRVDGETGERKRFSSKILAPWCRKSPKISEVLPLLYLHGLSSGDFVPAMEQFLGSAAGLSSATVTRLTKQWSDDHAAFQERDLSGADYVYVWADGVHPKVRLGQARSCVLVLMGVRTDGSKELIALAEGLRESTESWADLLRDCRRRGMRDPELVVGDGAMGLWRALTEVFPQARHQRCWVHKTRNVLNALPGSAQPGAKKALQEIYNAEDRDHAEKAVKDFGRSYGAKWPKAVKKITDDVDELLAFYDFPAEHWVHLRTTNPIESTFSTVKLRTKVTRGAGSPAAALAMVFKLAESAQARWRAITAPHLVALVRSGARFERGVLVEREREVAA